MHAGLRVVSCIAWIGIMIFMILAPDLIQAARADEAQPRLLNARMINRQVTSGLESEFRAIVASQSGPAWIGYGVPAVAGEHLSGSRPP